MNKRQLEVVALSIVSCYNTHDAAWTPVAGQADHGHGHASHFRRVDLKLAHESAMVRRPRCDVLFNTEVDVSAVKHVPACLAHEKGFTRHNNCSCIINSVLQHPYIIYTIQFVLRS